MIVCVTWAMIVCVTWAMIVCVLRAIAAVAVAADDTACFTADTGPPPEGLDDGFRIPPGARPGAGGGAADEISNGEPIRCRLPVRLRACCPGLLVRLRAFCPGLPVTPGWPARTSRTGCSGRTRWRSRPVLGLTACAEPGPDAPGGITRMAIDVTNVNSTTAVTRTALGTANPAGWTRAAAATDRPAPRPPARPRSLCMAEHSPSVGL